MATEIVTEKQCRKCKEVKALDRFNRSSQTKDGRRFQCKRCMLSVAKRDRLLHPERYQQYGRDRHLWERYRVTKQEYDAWVEQQNGACALCKETPDVERHHSKLQVDHCHDTGRIRGLLCNRCNNALGALGDSVAGVRAALAYLEREEEWLRHTTPSKEVDRVKRGKEHHWITKPETRVRGERHGSSIMSETIAREILQRAINGENQYRLAEEYGVSQPTVSAIKVGRNWSHLQNES